MNNLNLKHQCEQTAQLTTLTKQACLLSAYLAFLTASSSATLMAQYNGSFVDFRPAPGLESSFLDAASEISNDGLSIRLSSTREGSTRFDFDFFEATRQSVHDPFDEPIRIDSLSRAGFSDEMLTQSSDGLTTYFSSDSPAGSSSSVGIWTATRETLESEWNEPQFLDTGLNARTTGHPRLSNDDLTLYFDSSQTSFRMDLFKMERESPTASFGDPEPILELNTSESAEFLPSLSSDDLAIFYSSGTNQADNLHMMIATRKSRDEAFGQPVDLDDFGLGSDLNRSFEAWIPVIAHDWPADGSKLYFTATDSAHSNYEIYEATWNVEQVGDYSANGSLDIDDLNRLTSAIRSGSTHRQYDVDQSGIVDLADRDYWVTDVMSTSIGDANLDGQVTATDLNALALNWRATDVTSWSQGDFTGDGVVDAKDLNAMALNWQRGVAAAAASPAAVPEPSSIALLLVGLCAVVRRSFG